MKIAEIARICHEVNRGFCEATGDDSQPVWERAPEWQKESAVNGVKFRIKNPHAPASMSHESWLAEKAKDGWKYGAFKNPSLKEHPCFVPYDQLPKVQQAKDHLFIAVVDSLC